MKKILYIFIIMFACNVTVNAQEEGDGVTSKADNVYNVTRNLDIFSAIYKKLDYMYVDTLDPDVTVGAGIKSMLRSLDPYTMYYPSEDTKELKQMLTGKYAGIGAIVRLNTRINNAIISEPYEGMPSAEVGLRTGDVILSIDDSTMIGKPVSYVSSHLRGEPGTTFLLKVFRPTPDNPDINFNKQLKDKKGKAKKESANVLTFRITRKAIQLPSVPCYGILKQTEADEEKIGYLQLTQFTDNCSRDMRRAIVEMRQQGMKSLIIDLRDNGGGSLSEAVQIVNMFVPKNCVVVTTKGKLERNNRTYTTTSEPIDTVMPIVVLVNDETASASEITSGSLQDFDRAVIMGTRTYGKGLVQQMIDLPHESTMKVTVSKYYIPSGRCIQAINYKHTGGGYREHIPDSLTHEFTTRGGRIVRDGGGIKPDVEVKPDSLPNIVMYLARMDSTEVMLGYVVDYISTHPTIAPADEFNLTDAEFADFKQRVLDSGFTYDRETSKVYDELVKFAKFEGYYDDAQPEFEALKEKLQHNLSREIDNNREKIQRALENLIVQHYYFQKGYQLASVRNDNQVQAAIELLKDKARYESILKK